MSSIKHSNKNKKDTESFKKKNIKHDPRSESARAVFATSEEKHLD